MPSFSVLTSLFVGLGSSFLATAEPYIYDGRHDISYTGISSVSTEHFLNIKFGQDTSGTRRFAPPEPFLPAAGSTVNATVAGPACPQLQDAVPPAFDKVEAISEDCLNLRISRPSGTSAKDKLPVLVWIHGGGVVRGSAYDSHFDPDKLLSLSSSIDQPVIHVAIQHRLSIFGFASLDSLREERSLNAGMRDQRLAFQWLKDNIDVFGGDSERITAWGQSAGGTFISLQHFAYGGQQGLPFDQAWMMSGPPGTALNMTSDATETNTKAVAKGLGCKASSHDGILACLRDASLNELLKVEMEYAMANHPPLGLFTFLPSVDGDILPDRPSQLLRQGRFVKGVPSILGWTQDDGAMNAGPAPMINSEKDMETPIRNFASGLSKKQMSRLIGLYPASDFQADVDNYEARKGPEAPPVSPHYFAVSRLLRDLLFSCSSFDFTYQVMKHTRSDPTHKSRFNNVRLYDLNQSALNPLWEMVGMPWMGTSHGSDINYLFNGNFPEGQLSPSDQALARQFSGSLINFAYHADPVAGRSSGAKLDAWPVAYEMVANDHDDLMASAFNLAVVGGPSGSQIASVRNASLATGSDDDASDTIGGSNSGGSFGFGNLQGMLGALGGGSMRDASSALISSKIADEKLFERCTYINSLSETLSN